MEMETETRHARAHDVEQLVAPSISTNGPPLEDMTHCVKRSVFFSTQMRFQLKFLKSQISEYVLNPQSEMNS